MKTLPLFLLLSLGASAQTSVSISVNGIPNQTVAAGVQTLQAIPTPPAGAVTYTNLQNAAGWIACTQSCAGAGPGIASATTGIASPSLSGASLKLSLQNQNAITALTLGSGGTGYTVNDVVTVVQSGASAGTATVTAVSGGVATAISFTAGGQGYSVASGLATTGGTGTGLTVNITAISSAANALFYLHQPCPALAGGCAALKGLQIIYDYWSLLPTATGVQAIEHDPDIYDGTNEYFNSGQCDSASGNWRLWNMSNNTWVTTYYPCTFLTTGLNQWHHIREYTVIDRITGYSEYRAFEYDGVTIWNNLNQKFPFKANAGTATFNVEHQIDLKASAGFTPVLLYIDNMNATLW